MQCIRKPQFDYTHRILHSRTRLRAVLPGIVLLLSTFAALRVIVEFLRIIPWYLRGTMDSDVLLYFSVGRGILNGLLPYIDLFETKPPGMFLLAALSLKTTGDERLLGLLAILCLLIVAAIPVVYAWALIRRETDRARQITVMACAAAGGMLMALYLERWATGMETEIFGGAAVALYALTLIVPPRRAWVAFAVRSLLLFAGIFLKEYFALIALAVSVLPADSMRTWVRSFPAPLAGALALHGLALFALGYLSGYWNVYLPVIFGARMTVNPVAPEWILTLDIAVLSYHLFAQFTESRGLLILLFALIGLFPLLKNEKTSWKSASRCVLGWTLLAFLIEEVHVIALWANAYRQGVWIQNAYPQTAIPLALVIPLLLWWTLHRTPQLLPHMLRMLGALLVIVYVITSAGSAGNHFAAAVPVYVTLLLLGVRFAVHPGNTRVATVLAIFVIASTLLYRTSPDDWTRLAGNTQFSARQNADLIGRVDAVMDRCAIDRYLNISSRGGAVFTRHSTWGPLTSLEIFRQYLPFEHPLNSRTEENLVFHNLLVLSGDTIVRENTRKFVEEHFTQTPPPCAAGLLPLPDGMRLWFRR